MDVTELFWVDDLLDLSNDELFSPNSTTTTSSATATTDHPFSDNAFSAATIPYFSSTDFTDHLSVPSDDVAELEWLSNFVDDSFTDFSWNFFAGTVNLRQETATYGRSRSKRFRSTTATGWTSSGESHAQLTGKSKTNSKINNTTRKREGSVSTNRDRASSAEDLSRRCTHCSSEKTPQWRTGPLGTKTLCNACGVRYKSGRLVPEYRPAASPTFVLTQHSNSHRKVLELCRQKELLRQHQHQ